MKSKTLLTFCALNSTQQNAVARLYEHNETILYAKMGAGKTIITLTAISDLFDDAILSRVLIIAPKRVCENVWCEEPSRWAHTRDLNIALATGNEAQRVAAIQGDADIVVLNTENAAWFFKTYKRDHNFDGLVIDELSKYKTVGSQLVKSARRYVTKFTWRVGLTGTPVSENFEALYSQALVIDGGKALGTSKQRFLDHYFTPLDYKRYNWALKPDSARLITQRVSHLIYKVDDYRHTLPDICFHRITFDLPEKAKRVYDQMKQAFLVDAENDPVIAANAAVQSGKLTQIAAGFLRDTEKQTTYRVHMSRLYAVESLVYDLIKQSRNVVIAYWYVEDRQRLRDCFDAPCLGAGMTPKQTADVVKRWNLSEIPVLLLHPRSAGHGLNLQAGGCDLIWYTPVWSRDLFEQTNARLHRTGQTQSVNVYTLIANGTIDEIIEQRVGDKARFDALLSKHLND